MGTRQRRDRERQQRRSDILAAARELFWRDGYERTTMPRIAEAVQLAPGTLYLYFPGKEALYVELLMDGLEALRQRLEAAIPADAPPRRQAEALVDTFMQFAVEAPQCFDIVFFVAQREGRPARALALDAKLVERLTAKEAECKAFAADILMQAGYREPGPALDAAVEAAWSMLVGVVFYFAKGSAEAFAPVAREARELLLHGVLGT